jgi:hypothetical protein
MVKTDQPRRIDLTTERGVTISVQVPTLGEALELMRLMDAAGAGATGASEKLLVAFAEATGLGDARVTPVEVLHEILPQLLSLRGSSTAPHMEPASPVLEPVA